ncbi:pinopsin-like [Montipora foliosa]|uniref:pinopsin-like n=1 Tax=Montipora foliosa TaxID=591990 RepID=UPI0035F15D80
MAEFGNSTSLGELNDTLFGVWSFSHSECITWMIVQFTVSVSIVTLNGLSIIVFLRERRLRKRHMYLVINLTVADLFTGLFSPPILVQNLGFFCPEEEIFLWFTFGNSANILFGLGVFFLFSSVASLAAISLERLHATFRPFKHRVMKKKTFGAAVFAVWFTAGILSAVNFLLTFYGVYVHNGFHVYLFLSCCLLIILVSYVSIAAKINGEKHPRRHGGVNKERKLTKTLFIVTSASLMLSSPHIILHFLDAFHYGTNVRVYLVSLCLFYSNSLVNPIFYGFRMPEFKRALFSVLLCRPLSAHHIVEIPLNVM